MHWLLLVAADAVAHVDEPLERDERAHQAAHQHALGGRPAVRREVEQQPRSSPSLASHSNPIPVLACRGRGGAGAGSADDDASTSTAPPCPSPRTGRVRGEVDGERIERPRERQVGEGRKVRERVERPAPDHPHSSVRGEDDVREHPPHVQQRPADPQRAPPQPRQHHLVLVHHGGGRG